jgi:hypothetical protein
VGATDVAQASPLPFVATWSLSATTDKVEVTALGDTSKVYVAGLPDASGEAGGFMTDDSAVLFTAAADGLSRKTYIYPNLNVAGSYWFGTAFWDASFNAGVDGAGEFSGSFSAATPFQRVG